MSSNFEMDLTETFPTEITVAVTQEDIDRGRAHTFTGDPIAIACKRIYPDFHVEVDSTLVTLALVYRDACYVLPRVASEFVKDFDRKSKKGVGPIQFTARKVG